MADNTSTSSSANTSNTVTVSGMFSSGNENKKTYFTGSPVVIDISGLQWSGSSPFNIVKITVMDSNSNVIGDFHADTGGQTEISFDIHSALRALWTDYDFKEEIEAATKVLTATSVAGQQSERSYRSYSLQVSTEYLDSTDNEFTSPESETFTGGQCMIGALTEWERYNIGKKENADASHWENTNNRNGDASTKPNPKSCPNAAPERVGQSSITSWVDVNSEGTVSIFYPPKASIAADVNGAHAPIVLRDNQNYQDFLFVNRRGAVETCSALMRESLNIDIDVDSYNRVERPNFIPSWPMFAVSSGGRRSWDMSSGYVDRYWAGWWVQEFLKASRHWMLIDGQYVPVIVEPSKKSVPIYDKTKQQMPHVDFTVMLALEG